MIEQELADQVGFTNLNSAKGTLTSSKDFNSALHNESDLQLNYSVSNLRAPKIKLVSRVDTIEMLMENLRYEIGTIRKDQLKSYSVDSLSPPQ